MQKRTVLGVKSRGSLTDAWLSSTAKRNELEHTRNIRLYFQGSRLISLNFHLSLKTRRRAVHGDSYPDDIGVLAVSVDVDTTRVRTTKCGEMQLVREEWKKGGCLPRMTSIEGVR